MRIRDERPAHDSEVGQAVADDPFGGVGVGNPAREHDPCPVPNRLLDGGAGGGVPCLGHTGRGRHQFKAALHARRDVEGVDARVREGAAQLHGGVEVDAVPGGHVLHGGMAVEDGEIFAHRGVDGAGDLGGKAQALGERSAVPGGAAVGERGHGLFEQIAAGPWISTVSNPASTARRAACT